MRFAFISLCVITIGLAGAAVRAQDPPDEAMDFFKKGVEFFNAGNYKEAAEAFRKAYELKPNWKLQYNIGQSEAAAKRHGLALLSFEAYLTEGGDDIPNDRRDELLREVERLRKMVGTVKIEAPAGADIFIDGIERGRAPLSGAAPVEASVEHKVAVSIDGEMTPEQTFQVMGGQMATLYFEKPEPKAEKPSDIGESQELKEPASGGRTSPVKVWGWVAVGLGGAVAAGGAVMGGVALSMNKELEDECDPSCGPDYQSDVDTRDGLALAADILIPTGAVLATAGILMLTVFSPDKESETGKTLALRPVFGPRGAGASIEWRF